MSDDSHRADRDPTPAASDPSLTADSPEPETGPAPTPFDHPFFLPAVCIGFTLWFGYDTYLHPMEEHLDFNFYGFKIVLAASVWYGYLAYCETQSKRSLPWVLPAIFAVLAGWMGAEAFGLLSLPDLVEYPAISRWGFYASAAMVPVSALREWLRVRRQSARVGAA